MTGSIKSLKKSFLCATKLVPIIKKAASEKLIMKAFTMTKNNILIM